MTSLLWFLTFLFFVFLGIPVAAALGLAVIVAIFITGDFQLMLLPNMMFTGVYSFTLLAVPFFILAGKLMSIGSLSNRIFDFANATVGWMRGGMGAANVIGSMIFGGLSGSGVADVGALGPLEVRTMVKNGYDLDYACAVTSASAVLSPIIPPSVIMIVYANTAGVSAVKMLVAGLLPGILAGIFLLAVNYTVAVRRGWLPAGPFDGRVFLRMAGRGFWALMAPVILIGGIISGILTPTEAACVAALYALLVGIAIYRDVPLRLIARALLETGRDSGVILLILAAAMVVSHMLNADGVTRFVGNAILSISQDPTIILILVACFLILFGTVMETIASIIITVPIFLPIAIEAGISPIHFGVVMIVANCIGYITPPVGVCLFAICTVVKGATIEGVSRACLPFILGLVLCLLLIILIPWFSESLPAIIG